VILVHVVQVNRLIVVNNLDGGCSALADEIPQAVLKEVIGEDSGSLGRSRTELLGKPAEADLRETGFVLGIHARRLRDAIIDIERECSLLPAALFVLVHAVDGCTVESLEPQQAANATAATFGLVLAVKREKGLHVVVVEANPVVDDGETDDVAFGVRAATLRCLVKGKE
jgi:hypothetical protein